MYLKDVEQEIDINDGGEVLKETIDSNVPSGSSAEVSKICPDDDAFAQNEFQESNEPSPTAETVTNVITSEISNVFEFKNSVLPIVETVTKDATIFMSDDEESAANSVDITVSVTDSSFDETIGDDSGKKKLMELTDVVNGTDTMGTSKDVESLQEAFDSKESSESLNEKDDMDESLQIAKSMQGKLKDSKALIPTTATEIDTETKKTSREMESGLEVIDSKESSGFQNEKDDLDEALQIIKSLQGEMKNSMATISTTATEINTETKEISREMELPQEVFDFKESSDFLNKKDNMDEALQIIKSLQSDMEDAMTTISITATVPSEYNTKDFIAPPKSLGSYEDVGTGVSTPNYGEKRAVSGTTTTTQPTSPLVSKNTDGQQSVAALAKWLTAEHKNASCSQADLSENDVRNGKPSVARLTRWLELETTPPPSAEKTKSMRRALRRRLQGFEGTGNVRRAVQRWEGGNGL